MMYYKETIEDSIRITINDLESLKARLQYVECFPKSLDVDVMLARSAATHTAAISKLLDETKKAAIDETVGEPEHQ